MKKVLLFGLIFIFIAALTALAQNPREMKFPPLKFEPAEPTRFVADNGMVVYFLEDHQLPVITVSAFFHGGTVNDPADKIGLIDITASILRTGGAGKRTPEQIDQDLDFAAATIGSSAAPEYLDVFLSCLKKDIDLGFEIFSDVLQKPKFDSGKIALELSNTKDVIRRQNDDPNGVTRRVFYQTIYAGHPYGNFPTLASIDKINRDAIIAQYKQCYNPDNCLMAISGDMTLAEAKTVIAKYFGSWKKGNQAIPSISSATVQFKPGVYYAEKDINQANIRMGHLGTTDKNPDRYALDVFNFILGGSGFTSRLMREVRTTAGLAYNVGSYFSHRPAVGCFFAYCQTKADAMSQATELMLSIINNAKDSGITQEEMELAKESIMNGFVFNYATPEQIVNAKTLLELNGFPPDQLKKDLETYQAVTLDDCRRVAAQYLDPKNMVIVITGNKTLFDKPLETFGPVTNISMEIK
jgi:zinc protease